MSLKTGINQPKSVKQWLSWLYTPGYVHHCYTPPVRLGWAIHHREVPWAIHHPGMYRVYSHHPGMYRVYSHHPGICRAIHHPGICRAIHHPGIPSSYYTLGTPTILPHHAVLHGYLSYPARCCGTRSWAQTRE